MSTSNKTSKITMSLNQIKDFNPCESGWETLLKELGKTEADDEPIPLEFIVESNGIEDAIWCFRVNWFEHKELYMEFINECVTRAKEYAAISDTAATYAKYAVFYAASATHVASYATVAANYAAEATVASASAAAIERQKQKQHLLELLKS